MHAPDANDWQKGLLFTPELLACHRHHLVQAQGPDALHWLLAQALYSNLEFTQVLEHQVVNTAVYRIARNDSGFELPPDMVIDAWNILVDDSYHGKLTADLTRLVQAQTGIPSTSAKPPAFYERLQREFARADSSIAELLPLFFCSISETLITKNLVEIPRDPRVIDAVRQVMKDHAEDESRHHRFFTSFIALTWPQLSERLKQRIGPLLPSFIAIFTDTDLVAVRGQLHDIGLDQAQADEVINDCYSPQQVAQVLREASRSCMGTLRKVGVLDSAHVQDECERLGLLDRLPEDECERLGLLDSLPEDECERLGLLDSLPEKALS
ncbi:diiron oxygenase [Xanthomonas vasicola]|uniref:diiron oxygenase n=1 Tax=Xanthomonas vasicola TaxID=56459 RepID=UPI001E3292FD|nr:diiron oxygenase [Xanthomonas vasicola]